MKTPAYLLISLCLAVAGCSGVPKHPSETSVAKQEMPVAERNHKQSRSDLAERIACEAERRFKAGQQSSAYLHALAALDLDPENAKARYYFTLLAADKSWQVGPGVLTVPKLYYPTLPPRPVQDE